MFVFDQTLVDSSITVNYKGLLPKTSQKAFACGAQTKQDQASKFINNIIFINKIYMSKSS